MRVIPQLDDPYARVEVVASMEGWYDKWENPIELERAGQLDIYSMVEEDKPWR